MSNWKSKARFALFASLLGVLFIACSGDDNGGGPPNGGDGGIPSGDAAVDGAAPCDCSSLACQGPAAPIDLTIVTSFYEANRFLYEGTSSGQCAGKPLQAGVAPGTIVAAHDAVLHGKVVDANAQAIAGVTLSIVSHPEFGTTLSGPDGTFALAVNGGGQLAVRYMKAGNITVQRHALTSWLQYSNLADVVMVPASATTTAITLGSTSSFADGDTVTDNDGKRAAHVYFAPNTIANAVAANGTKTALSSLHLRMTELTSGAAGPQAMPADLPPTSAYTYCTSFGVDEAPDAVRVEFNPPAVAYVDNFLNFKPGTAIPDGAFQPDADTWESMSNGVVIKILTVSGGTATIDADGDGAADSPAQLSALGVTSNELASLGSKFAAGAIVWRVPTAHFTIHDFNLASGLPGGAKSPNATTASNDSDHSTCSSGSIIGCENQSLGEVIPLAGTGQSLMYTSERTLAYAPSRSVDVQLSDATLPSSVTKITMQSDVAGQHFSQDFTPSPNLKTTFTWNGKDLFGRQLQGTQPVKFTIDYFYDADYTSSSIFSEHGTGVKILKVDGTPASTRQQIALETVTYGSVTSWDERGLGLDGWTVAAHHVFDPSKNIVFYGNGTKQTVETLGAVAKIVAGSDPGGTSAGDGGPATQASFSNPHGIAVAPDGTAYIADETNHKIRKIDTSGTISTFAGTGTPGFSGDGGQAKNAQLQNPMGLALGTDGSLYVADFGNFRVRRITPDGTISTYAGNGTAANTGDGGAATSASLREPHALAIGADQSVYVTDTGACTVRRILPNGIITTVVGTGTSGTPAEGVPAAGAQLGYPSGVAVGPDGSIFIADRVNFVIWRITPDGTLTRFAGTTASYGQSGDGGFATLAQLNNPHTVDVGADLNVYITDELNGVVRKVDTAGIISTVAGDGVQARASGVPPLSLSFALPRVIKVVPDGSIWLADYVQNQIFRISPARPLTVGSNYVVPTSDGRAAFVFDPSGRHLRTVDTVTGVALLTFGYDTSGRLSTIADRDGNTTSFARDASGLLSTVTSPWSHVTSFTADANGFLATSKDPAAATTSFATSADGLLQSRKMPNGDTNTFTYDANGRLTKDAEPWGGFKTLTRGSATNGWSVAVATAQGRTTTHDIQQDAVNGETRTTHLPDGNITTWNRSPSEAIHVTNENGAVLQATATGDPRFDMMAPVVASGSYTTPASNGTTMTTTRAVTLTGSGDPTAPATYNETATLGGNTWTRAYDATSRTWLFTSPAGRTEQVALDTKGHVIEVDAPNRAPMHAAYDTNGRVSSITQDTRTNGVTYDAQSNVATVTDALSHTTHFAYDAVGRTTSVTRADSQNIGISYDVNGNVASVTPPGKTAHDFTYTAGDVPQAYKPPAASGTGATNTTYAFSQDLDLSTLTRADSQAVNFGYDTAGRLSSTQSSVGTTSLVWNPLTGVLGSVADPNGETVAFVTDGDLVTGVTWSGAVAGTVAYGFDTSLRVNQETAGGAAIAYGYDVDSLLTSAGSETLSRNALDGYLSGTSIGVASDALTFSEYGELATYAASISGTAIFAQNFTRDALGRVSSLQETIDGATHTYGYTYDLADRLATVTIDGAAASSYTYDANGNATSATVRGTTSAGSYDAQDRVTSYGTATFDWTAQGELLAKHDSGNTTTYSTDSLGRLQSVTLPSGHVVSYVYDGSNRRVGKKLDGTLVQGFLYRDAIKPVVELDGTGNVVSRFVYGANPLVPDYMVKGGNTYKIFADQIGSPRVVVDVSSGSIVERIDYDERGNTLKDTNPGFIPFGFAGGIVDRDTGLIRFGVRDYDPSVGRWTEKDAIGFSGGLNFYAYAGGDAINRVDPSGHFWWVAAGAVVGASADLAWQLAGNGGNFNCVNWGEVAGAGLIGAAVGLVGPEVLDAEFLADETGALKLGNPIKVIGRLPDTEPFTGDLAFEKIAIDPWSPEGNAAWIQSGIDANEPFYLASPIEEQTIVNKLNASGFSVFADELSQLLGAGYRVSGSFLVPP